MGDTDTSPVGRFSPAPGVFIDRTGNTIAITGSMEMFGPEANGARAHSVRHHINQTWTRSFPDGHAVTCNVTVTYRTEGTPAGDVAQIEALNIAGPSHVNTFTRAMTLNARESDAFTWTAAHEFGHVIGLGDRYSESIMSNLRGRFGGTRSTTVSPGYQANIMAVHGGALESQNLRDLREENAPNWMNDDDRVRDWITHHALAEVGLLATTHKLAMIQTLMGGWISEEDVAAIVRICSSVTSRREADAIRTGVDTVDFGSIGQRTRVRVAFANMP